MIYAWVSLRFAREFLSAPATRANVIATIAAAQILHLLLSH